MKPAKKSYPNYTLNENTRFSDITSAAGTGGQKHHTEGSNKISDVSPASMLIELVRQSTELMSRFIKAFSQRKKGLHGAAYFRHPKFVRYIAIGP